MLQSAAVTLLNKVGSLILVYEGVKCPISLITWKFTETKDTTPVQLSQAKVNQVATEGKGSLMLQKKVKEKDG